MLAPRPRAGVPIVINSDSHRPAGFAVARYGIATARRAWLTAAQVVNTQAWKRCRRSGPATAPQRRGLDRDFLP